jgi:hypothetical protein
VFDLTKVGVALIDGRAVREVDDAGVGVKVAGRVDVKGPATHGGR